MDIRYVLSLIFCAILFYTWEHCFDVPCQDSVDDGVYEKHAHGPGHGEFVVEERALPDVAPLGADPRLLVVGEVRAAKAERDVGDQALKI